MTNTIPLFSVSAECNMSSCGSGYDDVMANRGHDCLQCDGAIDCQRCDFILWKSLNYLCDSESFVGMSVGLISAFILIFLWLKVSTLIGARCFMCYS